MENTALKRKIELLEGVIDDFIELAHDEKIDHRLCQFCDHPFDGEGYINECMERTHPICHACSEPIPCLQWCVTECNKPNYPCQGDFEECQQRFCENHKDRKLCDDCEIRLSDK